MSSHNWSASLGLVKYFWLRCNYLPAIALERTIKVRMVARDSEGVSDVLEQERGATYYPSRVRTPLIFQLQMMGCLILAQDGTIYLLDLG